MKKEITEQLRKQLEEKKATIEKELESIAQKDPKFKGDYDTRYPDFGTHQSPDESALEVSSYESTLPIEYALEIRLQRINKSLDKIKKGTYGKCEKCGRPIDEKRLAAMPEAETCTKCQTIK